MCRPNNLYRLIDYTTNKALRQCLFLIFFEIFKIIFAKIVDEFFHLCYNTFNS